MTTNYTASCFVNGETTTPDICKKTLSVTPSGSSSGGPTPSCNDIIKNSAGNYTCYGNQYTDLFVMQCGTNTGGVVQYLGPTISIDSGEPGGRRIAQFSCAEPIIPRCFGALPGKSISQITDPLVWATSESCTIQTNPTCGDGVVHTGEECDMGINNGQPGYACSLTCSLPGGGGSNCGNGIKQ